MSKRHRIHKRRGAPPGAPPGTLIVDPGSAKPVVTAIGYGPSAFHEEVLTRVDAVRDYLVQWPVTWVNVEGLGDIETLRQLGSIFDLHGLALEDVLSRHERPKVEEYGQHLFLVTRMAMPGLPVRTEQLSIFIGERFVLTFQEGAPGDSLEPVRKRIREGVSRLGAFGSDYLAYSLVDAIIDAYFPHLDALSDQVEVLEEEVLERPSKACVSKIHEVKRDLISIRRAVSPLREVINALRRDVAGPMTDNTRVYLRDCYDHVVHILELVETYRDVVGGLLDVYLSSVSNRTNEIMKVLTIIATVFIPLTFVAGVYGMNFDTRVSPLNMPELGWYWGYPAFLIAIAAIAAIEIFVFWKRGWLSSPKKLASTNAPRDDADPPKS